MLFKDILDNKYKTLLPHFEKLLELTLGNQSHSADLLLINQNAVISTEDDVENPNTKKYFYEIGNNTETWSESTNHEFIGEYVRDAHQLYADYVSHYAEQSKIIEKRDQMDHELAFTMQFEMLIYLKIWEGETFVKKWYQLCRLLKGEDYDWTFKIKKHDRKNPGNLSRDDAFKKFIKPTLTELIPELGESFTRSHRPQVRNAIAHTQYFILGRDISFNNYAETKDGYVTHMDFEEWTDIFHETLMLFSLYKRFSIWVKDHYYEQSLNVRRKAEIRITWPPDPVPRIQFTVLHAREHYKDWSPYPNP